ncbi:MAG: hypothetical protein OEV73_05735, partial [Desulfobulbaceae bacterium]|nr:hypothetical protein [Desulfobulbaceae bacterium]
MHKLFSSRNLALFVFLFVVLGGCTVWLLEHNYINDIALRRSAKLIGIFGAPQLRFENLGLVYPHLPYYLLVPFFWLPGLPPMLAPYLASICAGAGLLVFWQQQMRDCGYGVKFRLAMLVAVIAHPYFLWAITSGTVQDAMSLVLFYVLYTTMAQLSGEEDVRAFILLALI